MQASAEGDAHDPAAYGIGHDGLLKSSSLRRRTADLLTHVVYTHIQAKFDLAAVHLPVRDVTSYQWLRRFLSPSGKPLF